MYTLQSGPQEAYALQFRIYREGRRPPQTMNARKVAFLTMADMGDFVTDYALGIPQLESLGWEVHVVAWREARDWNVFDAVYICVPWDYPQHADEFMAVLESIDASRARLCNPMSIVRWNLDKAYLRDIEARGDRIVPSAWYDDFDAALVPGFFAAHGVDTVVIKPNVGGNAVDTYVLHDPVDADTVALLERTFSGRRFVVQPFIANIRTEGEYSLFFFNGEYSHAILKVPKAGDFRVQEEHGADIIPARPPAELLEVGRKVFSHVQPLPAYGRGDWVRGPDGRFLLMELELIEPSLYLRTDPGAAARFARAFDQWFQKCASE